MTWECRRSSSSERRVLQTDMEKLMAIYKESYEKLRKRHEQLTQARLSYDKRVALLEEEMDELQEVMCMMRRYVHDT